LLLPIGLAAVTSVNAGLMVHHSTPNDLPDRPDLAAFCSTPNDLSELSGAEYFTCALVPNEKITVAALVFTSTRGRTKERDDRWFINQGLGSWRASLAGKPQNRNTAIDFDKLGLWNVLGLTPKQHRARTRPASSSK